MTKDRNTIRDHEGSPWMVPDELGRTLRRLLVYVVPAKTPFKISAGHIAPCARADSRVELAAGGIPPMPTAHDRPTKPLPCASEGRAHGARLDSCADATLMP